MISRLLLPVTLLTAGICRGAWTEPPPAPEPTSWTFKQELARPVAYHAREAYVLIDGYGLERRLQTVADDLEQFFGSAPTRAVKTLTLAMGPVDGPESYRLAVADDGSVTLTAEDDDGMRRGVYYFEDRVAAGDLTSVTRKPWLRYRISRCYFAPIKRPPFNRDELTDDTDYYPDAYLDRLAHEGVNGLWLTVEWRDLVETSFNRRAADAPKRLAKLRRTVEKCNRYGIRTWLFCIEPRFVKADDPLVKDHPEMFSDCPDLPDYRLLCPSTADGRRYIEEATEDLFRQVPGLPGILNLSHGERPTTCLSQVSPLEDASATCARCRSLVPGEIHRLTAEAFLHGMRRRNPDAELLSWFYQPHVACGRADWVADVPRYLPEGVTMLYNFESGAVKDQLGRYRAGGDYWLSYVGPSPAFERVAGTARGVGARLGAKIQVGCSHECATVPFVPVPGLLYRKYKAMKASGCSVTMQCWYFGNYPGIMNKAAGELAFSDFGEDETAFLTRLAAPEWGKDAAAMARLWQTLSDAYAEYPLSNDMQYYGPFHAGVAWPLAAKVEMKPLGRTWKPHDPPSGDAIGECLENHTLEEASLLATRMRKGVAAALSALPALAANHSREPDRQRDLGVIKALGLLFEAGSDIFDFYRCRARAIAASRLDGEAAAALSEVAAMRKIVLNEKRVTEEMLPLAREDSRLGFHSEAEAHQFHPAKLTWRLGELDRTLAELDEIAVALKAGKPYPLSEHEQTAATMRCGEWTETRQACTLTTELDSQLDPIVSGVWKPTGKRYRFRPTFAANGDFVLEGEVPNGDPLDIRFTDACGTRWPQYLRLSSDGTYETKVFNVITPAPQVAAYAVTKRGDGWTFRLVLDARGWDGARAGRPGWICFRSGETPVWPELNPYRESRLNIGNITPELYGRLVQ